MRSRRSLFESACRLGAFALLGWLLGIALTPSSGRKLDRADGASVADRLPRWTLAPTRVAMHVDLADAPAPWVGDWLAALRRAGRPVTWSGSPAPVAIVAERLADPFGGTRLVVAAPSDSRVSLRDDASSLDSVRVSRLGASVSIPILVGDVVATANGQSFGPAAADSLGLHSIVVVGRAGWEGKFIVAALEERGWRVTPRFSVAPGVDVAQGPIVLDTTRVSAVIAIDSSVAMLGATLERYVRDGGGLVLAGSAALASNVASFAPGGLGARLPAPTPVADTLGRASAGYYPVVALRRDAVPMERRADGIAVAARRVGAGRVVVVGFDESWRWRMAGAPGAESAHAEWWSRVVASVAYGSVRVSSTNGARAVSGAPLAELIDRLGPPRAAAPVLPDAAAVDPRLLLAALCILLLLEWGSRRLRGAR